MKDPITTAAEDALRLSLLAQRDALAAAVANARHVERLLPAFDTEDWRGLAQRAQERMLRRLSASLSRGTEALALALADTIAALGAIDER